MVLKKKFKSLTIQTVNGIPWHHMEPMDIVTSLWQILDPRYPKSCSLDTMIERWKKWCSAMSKNKRKSTLAQFGAKSFTGHRKLKIQILLQISVHNIIVKTPVKFHSSTSINCNYIRVSILLIIASNSCDITSDILHSSVKHRYYYLKHVFGHNLLTVADILML